MAANKTIPRKTVEVSDPSRAMDHSNCRNRCHVGAAPTMASKTGSTGIKCDFSDYSRFPKGPPGRKPIPARLESQATFGQSIVVTFACQYLSICRARLLILWPGSVHENLLSATAREVITATLLDERRYVTFFHPQENPLRPFPQGL